MLELIERDGVEAYEGSVRYVRAARDAGLHRAVVSSSSNCRDVLEAAGILDLFEEIVDGVVADPRGPARASPRPTRSSRARARLGVDAGRARPCSRTPLAGVEAGRAGGFGCVVGVDRVGHADALRAHGADIVVQRPRGAARDEAGA